MKNVFLLFTTLCFLSFSLDAQQSSSTTDETPTVKKNGFLSSLVVDEAGMPLIVQIDITDNTTNKIVQQFESSRIGYSRISLASGNYNIVFSKQGYLFHSENFILPDTAAFEKKLKKIILKKVQVGSNTELNNIAFEENKSVLKESSFTDLERVISLMNEIVSLQIEISGTVDDEDLPSKTKAELAEQRAKVLINYLVSKGIDKSRLKYKGADTEKPIELDSEEGQEDDDGKKTSLTIVKVENKTDVAQGESSGGNSQFGVPDNSAKKKTFGKKNKPKTELVEEKTDTVAGNVALKLPANEEKKETDVLTQEIAKEQPKPVVEESVKEEPKQIVEEIVKEESKSIVEEPVKEETKEVAKQEPVKQEKTPVNETSTREKTVKEESKSSDNEPVEEDVVSVVKEEPAAVTVSNDNNANNNADTKSINELLNKIDFEDNKSVLARSAFSDLDRVIELMNEIVSLEVEIPGNVDEDLPSKTKAELAEQRAQVLISYLVKQGIDRSRLKYKGENTKQPIELVKVGDENAAVKKEESAPVEEPVKEERKQEEPKLVVEEVAKEQKAPAVDDVAKEESKQVEEEVALKEFVKEDVKVLDNEQVDESNQTLKKILTAPEGSKEENTEPVVKEIAEQEPEPVLEEPVKQEVIKEEPPSVVEKVEIEQPQSVEITKEEPKPVNEVESDEETKKINDLLGKIDFEENKSVLRKSAFSDLDRVIELMNEIVSLEVEITGNVDEDLPSKTKAELSEQRAQVLINYLVKQGIDRSRLKYKGEDTKQPIELVKVGDENAAVKKEESAPVEEPVKEERKQEELKPVVEEVAKEEKAPAVEDVSKEESKQVKEEVALKEFVKEDVKVLDNEEVDESNQTLKKILTAPEGSKEENAEPVVKEIAKQEPVLEEPVKQEVIKEEPPSVVEKVEIEQPQSVEITKEEPKPVNEVESDEETKKINDLLGKIDFEENKSVLRKSAFSDLDRVIERMNEIVSLEVEITGNVDEDLPSKTKSELAEQRAQVLINYLVKQGIDRSRLKYKGENKKQPIELVASDENSSVEKDDSSPLEKPLKEESKPFVQEVEKEELAALEETSKEEKAPIVEEVAKEETKKEEVKEVEDEPIEKSKDAIKKILTSPTTPESTKVAKEAPEAEELVEEKIVKEEPKTVVEEDEKIEPKKEEKAPVVQEIAKEEPVKEEEKAVDNEKLEKSNEALKNILATPIETKQEDTKLDVEEIVKEESAPVIDDVVKQEATKQDSPPIVQERAKEERTSVVESAKEEVQLPTEEPVKEPVAAISLPNKFVKYDKDKNGNIAYKEIMDAIDNFFDDDTQTNALEISELIEYFFDNQN